MNKTYTDEQLTHIRNQAIIYQCACPAHVVVVIDAMRGLYKQQITCLNETSIDVAVHNRIKSSAEITHIELEKCLTDILILEGWNLETLEMPEKLQKQLL